MLRYAIDSNFAQERAERLRFDSSVIWGGLGDGSAVETLVLPFGDPGSIPVPVLSKQNIGCSPVVIALALTFEVGGSIPRNPVLIFFSYRAIQL